jgi:hypothetical protein
MTVSMTLTSQDIYINSKVVAQDGMRIAKSQSIMNV